MKRDDVQPSDDLIGLVRFIADTKDSLPFRYRGLLNVQGVYYQARYLPNGSRLYIAGGRFIPKLKFTQELDGSVTVHKYQAGDWESALEPAADVAMKLLEQTRPSEEELTRRIAKVERKKREQRLSSYEERVRKDPKDYVAWSFLSQLYEQERRYKHMENAIRKSIEADIYSGRSGWLDYELLGRAYLAALSNSIRGKEIPIWGYIPSSVTPESLGYTTEQIRILAKENLNKAYELQKSAGFDERLEEIELALKATLESSTSAFERFDKFMAKKEAKGLQSA